MDNYTRSKRNSFTHNGLDRMAGQQGNPEWLAEQLTATTTRLLPVWQTNNLFTRDPVPHALQFTPQDLEDIPLQAESLTLLGTKAGITYFALGLPDIETPLATTLAAQGKFQNLRQVAMLLDRHEGGLLAYARAMTYWHHQHRFCGVCGSPTESVQAGHERVCTNPDCKQSHFPRTDPAIIVLTQYEDRALLGRQASWPRPRYSTIAGFVEPGESLEDTVAREVYEETGVQVESITYLSSQPWPFPSSLMIGFHAQAASDTIHLNDGELEDARWFSRAELRRKLEDHTLILPPSLAISFRLIEAWFDLGDQGKLSELNKQEW
ncbi:MAG: NAD(+) diphosphatase [Anaerolineae bacterium]|nr:NAD(+) diphosphatase [Anaerolineae bacterium]